MKYAISTKSAPAPAGSYSQGTTAGRLVFTAGQLGIDPKTSRLVEGGIEQELEQAITNCEAILSDVGCELADVAQTTVYLTNLDDIARVDQVYATCFPSPRPARTTVQVASLPMGALVELECIACR